MEALHQPSFGQVWQKPPDTTKAQDQVITTTYRMLVPWSGLVFMYN